MLLSLILAGFVAMLFVYSYLKDGRRGDLIRKLPGPKAIPVLGNAHQMTTGHKWFCQLLGYWKTYMDSGLFGFRLAWTLHVIIWKPEYVEALLGSSKHIDKSFGYEFVHPWLGTGLLTSTGSKWRERRKMLTPTFHFHILNDFVAVFNRQSRVLVTKLHDRAGTGAFNVFHNIAHCALDIICETAMGIKMDAQSKDTEYVRAVYRICYLIEKRSRTPWYWPDFLYNLLGPGKEQKALLNTLHSFTNSVIVDRLKDFDDQKVELIRHELSREETDTGERKNKRLAFLDMLLYMSDNLTTLSLEDIREEVDTFMFEGHDTTAAAINWVIHLVGANPEVQVKVHEELDDIFGDSDRDVTMDDLKNMKYLECCIKEALRIFPSVPLIARMLKEEIQLGEYVLPVDATAAVLITAIHRDPKAFPDPETYKPERFLLENSRNRHAYSYIPFSAGPRNCIGQKFALLEEKTVLSHIFRNFEVKSTQTREELRPIGELILKPETGIHVILTKRPLVQE